MSKDKSITLPETPENPESLQKVLSEYIGEEINLARKIPELGWTDAEIKEHKEFCGGAVDLWLCEDESGNRAIVRADGSGFSAIGLFESQEDQLTFAAWNIDFDIRELSDWVTKEDMDAARDACEKNEWGVGLLA